MAVQSRCVVGRMIGAIKVGHVAVNWVRVAPSQHYLLDCLLLERALPGIFSDLLYSLVHPITLHATAVTAIGVRVVLVVILLRCSSLISCGVALSAQVHFRLRSIVYETGR